MKMKYGKYDCIVTSFLLCSCTCVCPRAHSLAYAMKMNACSPAACSPAACTGSKPLEKLRVLFCGKREVTCEWIFTPVGCYCAIQ